MDGLIAAAEHPLADTVVTAVVGMLGLRPTLAAIRAKKRIALANKETLVCAGELVMREAAAAGAEIVPVDSEHSAIFQCLMGCRDRSEIRRLILTCSGGPFFGKTPDKLRQVTKADALRHPNWKMGEKITIDCATLMNKGLEVIEAIRLALTYPNRAENPAEPLDLLRCGPLTFDAPDEEAFPCFRLAKQAAQNGGTACAVLNGANETAVAHYLRGECGFYDIPRMVDHALQTVPFAVADTLETVLQADRAARAAADSWMR